MFDRIKLEPGV